MITKNHLMIGSHWLFARVSLLRFFCLIMLFAERSNREDNPPINIYYIYGLMGIALLTSIKGHLPKNILKFMLFITGFTNILLGLTFVISSSTTGINWKYRDFISLKSCLKLICSGSIYWRIMSGNLSYMENGWSWIGTSIHLVALILRGLLMIPSEFRVFHKDYQLYEEKGSFVEIPLINFIMGLFVVLIGLLLSLPLIMQETLKKFSNLITQEYQSILNWLSILPILVNSFNIDMNAKFWTSNGVDQWLLNLWIVDDFTWVLGTYVLSTFPDLARIVYESKKSASKKKTK